MDCGELRELFLSRGALTPEADAHARTCDPCGELVAAGGALGVALASPPPVLEVPPFEALAARVAEDRGLRARLAGASTPVRTLLVWAAVLVLGAAVGVLAPRPDLAVYPLGRMTFAVALLLCLAAPAAWAAARPLQRPPLARGVPLALALAAGVLGPAFLSVLPAAHAEHALATVAPGAFAKRAVACFVFGLVVAVPLLALAALVDRAPRPQGSRGLLPAAAAGALVANLGLQLHCPITESGHLLVSHASVGATLIALALGALAWASRRAASA